MQFIPQGPDIPIELLNLHEEGRVVFFVGQGFHVVPAYRVLENWLNECMNRSRMT